MAEPRGKSNYSTLKRPQHLSLVDIAYNVLLEAIVNQEFEPGAQISIDSLARQLNMSNTPVREALMRANGERLVQQKTNHGFVVADLLSPVEVRQLFEVRHILEIHALEKVTITDEAVVALEQIVEAMHNAKNGATYEDFKDYMQLDHQFHRVLVGLSGNGFLLKSWEDLHVHLHLSRLYTGIGLFDRTNSAGEHQAIVDALRKHDKARLIALVSEHVTSVEQRLQTLLARE
jgi:DNA-binding GntR family transcriptional regulator